MLGCFKLLVLVLVLVRKQASHSLYHPCVSAFPQQELGAEFPRFQKSRHAQLVWELVWCCLD